MKTVGVLFALSGTLLWGADSKPSAVERLGIAFNPPKEPEKTVVPAFQPGTVIMPRFEIKDTRLKLTKEDLVSPAEKLIEARKEYISPFYAATFGPVSQVAGYLMNLYSLREGWRPNANEATVLYLQDSRLRKIREFDNLVDLVRLTDPKEAKELAKIRGVIFRQRQKEDDKFYRKDLHRHDRIKAP